MASSVQPARFLDGAILSLFVMLLSALTLYLFGEFWSLSQHPKFSKWNIGLIMQRLFPFKKSFDFNLTHILLLSVCILLLSLKPDFSVAPSRAEPRHKSETGSRRGEDNATFEAGEEEEGVTNRKGGKKSARG
eukprot:GHVS01103945.1.p1 GENE.GHVS01103945.1~~GHVS01103945.1.p1  ORF type:complete len:144 (+),score=15.66 GHVS01103945.1:34-432(+)